MFFSVAWIFYFSNTSWFFFHERFFIGCDRMSMNLISILNRSKHFKWKKQSEPREEKKERKQ